MTGNQLYFEVKNQVIHLHDMRQYECRGDCCLELLCDLVENWPDLLEGRTGSIFANDAPPPEHLATQDLNFCTTVRIGDHGKWLPFPDFTSLRWPQIGVPDAETLVDELLADEREWDSGRIFWIGSDQHPSRRALWEMGKHHAKIMDIVMMEWDRTDPGALVSTTRQVSLRDHRLFKYLVDCPGRGYSGRLKWLLATGRPVFVVDRNIVEPWHERIVPWVHYVPVAADLSDLLERHAALEGDPSLYEEISRNARRFVAENLSVEAQLSHTAEAISGLLKRNMSQNFKPEGPIHGSR